MSYNTDLTDRQYIGYLDRGKLRLTVSHDKAEKRQYKTYLEELKEEPIASI